MNAIDLDKKALVRRALESLGREMDDMRRSAAATREGAVHEESRPENDKDTRGLEASYLARGQAARLAEMEEEERRLRFMEVRDFGPGDRIALSALVTVDVEGTEQRLLVVPSCGGLRLDTPAGEVQLVTPAAPLGRLLVGKEVGDDFELKLRGSARAYEVVGVS